MTVDFYTKPTILNPIYTLTYQPNLFSLQTLNDVIAQLEVQIEINSNYLIFDPKNQNNALNLNLVSDEVDILVTTLNNVPLKIGDEWVIAALIAYEGYTQGIYIHSQSLEPTADLRLRNGTFIGVIDQIDGLQLKALNNNIEYKKVDSDKTGIELLKSREIGALFINKISELSVGKTKDDLSFIPINAKEMIPSAGSKAIAILCRKENIILRKAIQKIHNKEVSKCTNIERKTAQLLAPNETRSYCEVDSRGNFHLHLTSTNNSGQLQKVKVSQSTTTQLLENAIIALNQA